MAKLRETPKSLIYLGLSSFFPISNGHFPALPEPTTVAPWHRLCFLRRHSFHGLAILLTAVETLDAKCCGLLFLQQVLDG
jgi:hypothetical protein